MRKRTAKKGKKKVGKGCTLKKRSVSIGAERKKLSPPSREVLEGGRRETNQQKREKNRRKSQTRLQKKKRKRRRKGRAGSIKNPMVFWRVFLSEQRLMGKKKKEISDSIQSPRIGEHEAET